MHQLPFETLTQFVALGLTLIAGWLLGMASHSGGAKWRERYQDEALDHAGYRDRAEQDLRDAHRKIKALEAENAALAKAPAPAAPPEGHSTGALAGAAAAGAVAGAAIPHAAEPVAEEHPEEPTEAPAPADSHA